MTGPSLHVHTRKVKRALSITVRYEHLRELGFELPNVHKDTKNIRRTLIDLFGYAAEDIVVLRDHPKYTKPTLNNIVKSMKALVHGAQPGDRFVCHISGHGSQVPNVDHTELDGYDEVFWPSDVEVVRDKDGNLIVNNYLLDDTIKNILVDSLPVGAHLVMIFDCCHSGTMSDLPNVHCDKVVRRHFNAERSRRYNTSDDAAMDSPSESPLVSPVSELGSISGLRDESFEEHPNVICWSACRDAQLTFEHCRGGGQFVKFLSESISDNPSQTHENLLHDTRIRLEDYFNLYNKCLDKTGSPLSHMVHYPRPQLSTLCNYASILKLSLKSVL